MFDSKQSLQMTEQELSGLASVKVRKQDGYPLE